jgi:hypothetical protein
MGDHAGREPNTIRPGFYNRQIVCNLNCSRPAEIFLPCKNAIEHLAFASNVRCRLDIRVKQAHTCGPIEYLTECLGDQGRVDTREAKQRVESRKKRC